MMKNMCLFLILFYPFQIILGQIDSNTYTKWYLKPAIGVNLPITKLLTGELTDNLFGYNDHSNYIQFLSVNYFFNQKWGIEFTYQIGKSDNTLGRSDRFYSAIDEHYNSKYYISNNAGFDDTAIIEKGYIGAVYRIEKRSYIILPKLLISSTSFYTDWGEAKLKEKGSHHILDVSYSAGDRRLKEYFNIIPAITFGYRISNKFFVNIDFFYSYFKSNIEFIKETRDVFSRDTTTKKFNYKKGIHNVSIGFGLIYEIKRKKIKTQGYNN